MSNKALISGRAGVAVLLHDGRTQSFHLDGPTGVERRREEIRLILGDCTDVIVVDNIAPESVSARLELEWAKQRCLALCLLLLDIESHPESRLLAVADMEDFLRDPEIAGFLRARLFAAPMPDKADLIGAINRAHSQNATSVVSILEEVGVHQGEIARCRSSWDAVPPQTFRDESSKEGVAFALIQAGAFPRIVTTAPEKRGALLLDLLARPELRQWRVGLTAWINSLSVRNRDANRAVEEERERSSLRSRPTKQTRVPADALLEVVNRQKDAIRNALASGDSNQARAFCADLRAYQERNSRPEHIAMSLCDLAQAAKDLGYHQLQLEWTQEAVDIAPGDAWSLAQLGDAYRCLGQWSKATEAFNLAWRHGNVVVARTGRAEVLKAMGRLEDALQEYEATAEEFPQSVVARTGRAEVLKAMGRLDEALREYDAIVEEFPQEVFPRTGRAEVLKTMGRTDEALREYEATIKEFPKSVVARNGRAEVLKAMGRLGEALREYEGIVSEFPQDVVARAGRAEVLKAMGRPDEALREYEATIKEFPQDVVARTGRAEALKAMGRLDDALQEYGSVIKEFPHVAVARNGRAEVLKAMGRLDDALQEYGSVIKEFPHVAVARSGRADVLKAMGRLDEALREYESIIKELPQEVFPRTGRAEVLKAMGRLDDALQEYGSVIKEFPHVAAARNGRAEVLKAMGRLGEALREYEAVIREFPHDAVARNGRAEVLKAMGRLDEALQEYESVIKEFPHDVIARNGRAEVLRAMGRLGEALREYEATIKGFPQDVFARNGRAEALKTIGSLDDALQEYESVIKEFPRDVVARNGRAEVLKAMGSLDDALQEYESIIKEFPHDVVARNGAASVCVLMADYESAIRWISPLVDAEPVDWVGLHILGMIRLRTGRAGEAVAIFERGLRDGSFGQRQFFRSGLAYARLLARDLKQAAKILEDEPSLASRVLQIHIYGELDQTDRARQAYDVVRPNRNPRVIELTTELAARARLEMRAPTRSEQWIFDREFELLLAA